LLAIIFVNGCGYIYGDNGLVKSQEYSYVNSKEDKELEIPADLTHESKANYTVVPKIGKKSEKSVLGKQLTQIAPAQLLTVMDNTRVDKNSDIPAVLIVDDPNFIWQTTTLFLQERLIENSKLDASKRTLETNWIAIEDGGIWLGLDGSEEPDELRAKYKISLSNSDIKKEYQLKVERSHNQYWNEDDELWKEIPVTWHESADMMNLILSYYDQRIRMQDARHQLEIMAGFKVELGQDSEGKPALITSATEALVWEKIPRVMNELGLTVIDRDRRQKTYFMEYKAVESGFFASLFDDEGPKLPLEEGSFQMTISEIGELRALTIKNGEGVAIEADLLVALYPDLSRLFGDRR